MASKVGTVWAIDIGNNSLKALRLGITASGGIEVLGFDSIAHGKILSGSGVKESEKEEQIAITLRRFIEQNELGKDQIAISVPSQNSFARFVNLPPVEQKRIPEIVKVEASQQIPFDITEVQWDWQLMGQAEGSKQKVGIFAIKTEVVDSLLDRFRAEDTTVSYVQMAPMALYNYVLYDRAELEKSENQAIIALDVGAENTDLVVCKKGSVWQRSVPMGGNSFTRAIAETFKLNFNKAEKLKRTAPMSKYARQIFQAMRPVYTDLVSEIQRSLNYYSSSNPETKFVKVIAMGGGAKIRGLLKYLRQTLRIPVEKPDLFQRLSLGPGVSEVKFHENVSDFGIVYGLGVQALGFGGIESNLLPRNIARSMEWASKAKYFTAAACLLLLVSLMSFARTSLDRFKYGKNEEIRLQTGRIIQAARQAKSKLAGQEKIGQVCASAIKQEFEPFSYRNVVPLLYQTIISQLPNEVNNKDQAELYSAFAAGRREKVSRILRKERKQIFVTDMSAEFVGDVNTAELGEKTFVRGVGLQQEATGRDYERERSRREMMAASRMTGVPVFLRKAFGEPGAAVGGEPGFVVTIAGYSPYRNLGELMDPTGVGNDKSGWGFVTRLMHLDDVVDGNCPFKLFNKSPKHFKLQIGEVDLDKAEQMPAGIGVLDIRFKNKPGLGFGGELGTKVLIDPMTKEPISKVPKFDDEGNVVYDNLNKVVYEVNDHWFVLQFKIVWEDASDSGAANTASSGTVGTKPIDKQNRLGE